MPLDPLQIARDLGFIVGDAPQEFTFQDSKYTGRIGLLSQVKRLEIGGFQEEPTLTLVVALSDATGNRTFGTRPKIGDRLTIATKEYRVVRSETDPFESMLTLDLATPEK